MSKAIRMHQTGGPEVLSWEDYDPGKPAKGEARVRHTAVGLNYIDTYVRTGLYPNSGLPLVLGMEAAGVVEEVGEGVTEVRVGDHVAYPSSIGSYCEVRLIPADKVVTLPAG